MPSGLRVGIGLSAGHGSSGTHSQRSFFSCMSTRALRTYGEAGEPYSFIVVLLPLIRTDCSAAGGARSTLDSAASSSRTNLAAVHATASHSEEPHDHRNEDRQASRRRRSPASISRKPLDDDTFAQVAQSVLRQRSRFLSQPETYARAASRFHAPLRHARSSTCARKAGSRAIPEILIVSNVLDEKGNAIGSQDAGRFWHSDLSYKKEPSMLSALYALEVPVKDGRVLGDTSFASTTAAYDALPQEMKRARRRTSRTCTATAPTATRT